MANETNTGLPTLANRVSSLFSGGMSIAGVDWTPRPVYFMSVLETAVLLQPLFHCSIDDMVAFCLYPQALGGFPVMMYSSMCVGGQMDPVSIAIAMLVHLWKYYKEVYSSLSKLVNLEPVIPVDYTMLVLDPYSLNILGENFKEKTTVRDKSRSTFLQRSEVSKLYLCLRPKQRVRRKHCSMIS